MTQIQTSARRAPMKTVTDRPTLEEARIYNRLEAAAASGVSYATIVRSFDSGQLSGFKQGKRVLHSGQHLIDWLKRGEVKAKK